MRKEIIIDSILYLDDCLKILPKIGPVDAIITDPPYGTTSCKWDTAIPFSKMWPLCYNAVKTNGAIVLFASMPFTAELVHSNIFDFKYEWIWQKAVGSNFAAVKYQPMKEHESICVFSQGRHNYYPVNQKRAPSGTARLNYGHNGSKTGETSGGMSFYYGEWYDRGGVRPSGKTFYRYRNCGDVLRYSLQAYSLCIFTKRKREGLMGLVTRPLLRYHGGKWRIAPWIISFFPPHRIYVELFGGGGSVLLRKGRAHEEIYNDLDSDIVNLFRVARDQGDELKQRLALTPFAREEFVLSYQRTDDPMERARRTVVRAFMGRGTSAATGEIREDGKVSTGFRASSDRAGKTASRVWGEYADALDAIVERLQGVVIENRDAIEVIDQQDTQETLFYADPPYVFSSRDAGEDYRYEMTDDDHVKLGEKLNSARGAVIFSGYDCELYSEIYKGWHRAERKDRSDAQTERTEVLWMKGIEPDLFNMEMGGNDVKN
jgi:DNA adenine methylase